MRAIVYDQYGPPDVLHLAEVQQPTVGDDDVLIKIEAASANPLDWHFMRGTPYFIRFTSGLLKPSNPIIGADVAGRVEAVGRNVTEFQAGDEVFGDTASSGLGGFAEYVTVPAGAIAPKPASVSFEEAAAVPVAGVTALQALRDKGRLQAGQRVLINGASGGVGTFAVQIAKAFGAEVTGVCSTRNVELVRSLGADHVIDYTREDFTRSGQTYNVLLDAVGNRSVGEYKQALTPDGICVFIGFSLLLLVQVPLMGAWLSMTGGPTFTMMLAQVNAADLKALAEMLEAGQVSPVLDRRYPLSEVPEAIRYLEEGHARGKVIITL